MFWFVYALACMVLGFWQWQQLQRFPQQPERMAVQDVPARVTHDDAWVELLGAQADCGAIRYYRVGRGTRTDAILTDETGRVVIVAGYMDRVTCDDIQAGVVSGTISRLTRKRYVHLESVGFDLERFGPNATFWDLHTSGGRSNTAECIGFCAVFGGIALLLALYFHFQCPRRPRRDPWQLPDSWTPPR